MTHDEMIAVIQAHKQGVVIEFRRYVNGDAWAVTCDRPSWNFDRYEYRVKKREPREWWFDPTTGRNADYKIAGFVHVREVL